MTLTHPPTVSPAHREPAAADLRAVLDLAPAARGAASSQRPVIDVVEDWGLASFPASDPPSNW